MKTVQNKGYTILELLIVVAISSSMFVVVAISFGGRQQQVQFTQAVRDFDSRLKDIMNDVSTGYFPETNIGCRVTGGASPSRAPRVDASPVDIGTNDECVLIGKAIQFSPEGNYGVNDNREIFKIFNIVGLRNTADNTSPISLSESNPRVVPVAEENQSRYGLRVTKILTTPGPYQSSSGGVEIFRAFNEGFAISSSTNEGIVLGPAYQSIFGMNESNFVNSIDTQNTAFFEALSRSSTTICLSDPSGDKVAYISVGGNQQLGTIIEFDEVGICS